MGEGQNREDGETARRYRNDRISAYRRLTDRTEVKRSLY